MNSVPLALPVRRERRHDCLTNANGKPREPVKTDQKSIMTLKPTLVTLTSDRPQAFQLCEKWISRQDFRGPCDWFVIDDGRSPVAPTMNQTHVRRRASADPLESFLGNLQCAIELTRAVEAVLFIEDDVYYRPDYLSFMVAGLSRHDVVGEAGCRDYDVSTGRHRICSNRRHASLCQTGIRASAAGLLLEITLAAQAPDIDRRFWFRAATEKRRITLFPQSIHSVNIKGLPGKTGFIGHAMQRGPVDVEGTVLRRWCGTDAATYRPFRKRELVEHAKCD